MKLLLINPKFPESFWSFKWAADKILPGRTTTNPPLGLATVAALCPPHWEVEIVDENVESIPLEPQADIIGICGMGVQFERQKVLLAFYQNRGYFVVAGGSYASLCPEEYHSLADSVISGEAEYIWPAFCRDFENEKPSNFYQETGEVDLADSPIPRYELLKTEKYRTGSLQFSRGCPFRCEFCDIIVMFGRKPRTKSPEQVGRELDLLRKLDVHNAFFIDDNLIGNMPVAKKLLKFLKDYQSEHRYRFQFGTEASLNMARDDELLHLFWEANFKWVFIGIESPDEESLKEAKKMQNSRQDILASVRKIYAHGLDIMAGFIVGFDNDTTETFEKQYQFIMNSGIQAAMIGLLTAVPKTPLYNRLEKEGRLIKGQNDGDNTRLGTNLIPKQMSYDQMVRGYRDLYVRLLQHRSIAERIKNKIRYLTRVKKCGVNYSIGEVGIILRNLFIHGLWSGRFSWLFHFLRTIPFFRPWQIPMVVQDWIVGLSMRDFVERQFNLEFAAVNQLAENYFAKIEKAFHSYLDRGSLEVSLKQVKNTASHLSLNLKGLLDKDFFNRAGHHLEKILEDTASSITLHIEELHEAHLKHFNRLLKRLHRYGDRIHIKLSEPVRKLVDIDSSVFHLVLEI